MLKLKNTSSFILFKHPDKTIMFNPQPKSTPKPKKEFGFAYWNGKRKEYQAKAMKKRNEGGKQDLLEKWYRFIWKRDGEFCVETGRKLPFDKKYCAHLLPKSKYPYFKTDPNNGLLLDWHIHDILDKGSAKQRLALKVWGQIRDARTKMLESVGLIYDEDYWLNSKF